MFHSLLGKEINFSNSQSIRSMPPKKQQKGPSNKTLEKEKKKVVEDKTFGLKNKNKSKVVQAHIK